jgi:DegV family protein with EDD domain
MWTRSAPDALQFVAMPGFVAIVTDSTACIPAEVAARNGIRIVQQQLQIGEQLDDESRVSGEQIVNALRNNEAVTTAPPDPGAFFWAFQDAATRGATAIVAIHMSSRLSQTCQLAKEAAGQVSIPVHVLDSGTLGMSLGFAVLAASRVAQAGGEVGQVLAIAGVRIARSTELVHVETLDYLRRGGRIGAAAHLIGNTFAIRPTLTIRAGEVAPLGRTLGADRALRKMVDKAVDLAGGRAVDLAVEHVGEDSRVPAIMESLRKRIPDIKDLVSVPVASIIAAHVGPGAMGITISPAV